MIFPVVTMSRRNGECYFYDGGFYLIWDHQHSYTAGGSINVFALYY